MPRIRSAAAALLVSAAVFVGSSATVPAVAAASEPPACSGVYLDVPAANAAYGDWNRTVLDTIFKLPSTYAPRDLVPVSRAGIAGSGSVRSVVIADLKALTSAASAAGAPIQVRSAYRSYATQATTFKYWVSVAGKAAALTSSARPGHSEHQLGTAIDFTTKGGKAPWEYRDWATTPSGAWMRDNAWTYGFVNSYPKGSSPSRTCYIYEPWHYRYVGRDIAAAIHESGVTPRQYMWAANGLIYTPKPQPVAKAAPKSTPKPAAKVTPGPTPKPVAKATSTTTPVPTPASMAMAAETPPPAATATPVPPATPTPTSAMTAMMITTETPTPVVAAAEVPEPPKLMTRVIAHESPASLQVSLAAGLLGLMFGVVLTTLRSPRGSGPLARRARSAD